MEILWAPWRMAYIERDQPKGGEESCIFCDAARPDGGRSDLLIHRTELAICMLNRYPYNPGHVMVAPHRHGGDLAELGQTELVAVMEELKLATRVLQQELKREGSTVAGTRAGRREPGSRTISTSTWCRAGTATPTSCRSWLMSR